MDLLYLLRTEYCTHLDILLRVIQMFLQWKVLYWIISGDSANRVRHSDRIPAPPAHGVLQAENTRFDAFKNKSCFSNRNSTAVCIYSIATIEDIFENSSFKGYSKDIPVPRPGTVKMSLVPMLRQNTCSKLFLFLVLFLSPVISIFVDWLFVTWPWLRPCHVANKMWKRGSVFPVILLTCEVYSSSEL